jgi:hypothetical protein
MKKQILKKKWLKHAVSGLILNGFGLSIFGEAIIAKLNQSNFLNWFTLGTIALILINSGISLTIKAHEFYMKYSAEN